MCRYRPLTLRPLRMLAALLLADGEIVPVLELLAIANPRYSIGPQSMTTHLRTLRAHGLQIACCRGQGYRLLAIPTDDVLTVLLPLMHTVKREWSVPLAGRIGSAA